MVYGVVAGSCLVQQCLQFVVPPSRVYVQCDCFYLRPFVSPVVVNRSSRIGSFDESVQQLFFAHLTKNNPSQIKAYKPMSKTGRFVSNLTYAYVF